MLLKKYKNYTNSKIKFIRVKLNWLNGESFCSDAANCKFSGKGGICNSYQLVQEICVNIGMDSRQCNFSYIPQQRCY